MKYLTFSYFLFCAISYSLTAQNSSDVPYESIGDYPDSYNASTVMTRLIDGLGYRYYWATERLREEDLAYKPSEDSRTAGETLDHLYGLSSSILRTISQEEHTRNSSEMTFEERRTATLNNLKQASDILLKRNDNKLDELPIVYRRGDQKSAFPFWNLINGQITDAIYHVGQIVAYRRASGNPMDPAVNVFRGKNR